MTLSYGSDATSTELAAGLSDVLSAKCDLDHVRRVWSEGEFDRSLWDEVSSLSFWGALIPEADGGLGVRSEDVVRSLEEFGYSGASLPLTETVAVVVPTIHRFADDEMRDRLLPGLLSGASVSTAAVMPGGTVALFADVADVALVAAEDGLYVLERDQFTVEPVHSPDPTSRLGRIKPRPDAFTPHARLGEGALDEARLRAVWATAAVLNGVSRRMLDLTVEHTKQREQFGRAIGTFQAVKHLAADVWVAVESSRPCSWYAAYAHQEGLPDAAVAASVAMASASDAARLVGDSALQLHGGIGFTWEHPLHFWLKRGKLLEHSYGSRQFHLRTLGVAIRDEQAGSEALFADV